MPRLLLGVLLLVTSISAQSAPPTLTIEARPAAGYPGSPRELVWAATGDGPATAGEPGGGVEIVGLGHFPARGRTVVAPTATTLYEARTSGPDGTVTASVTVEVVDRPPPPQRDVDPPILTITQPVPGATVRRTLTIRIDGFDNEAIVALQVLLDGSPLGPEQQGLAPAWTQAWNTRQTPTGWHVLSAIARDASGNVGSSPEVRVRVRR